jgi:peptidyl-tRNA hydrolase
MPPGKLAAQAGHGFLGAIQAARHSQSPYVVPYEADPPGTKIVLAAPCLDLLLQAHDRCLAAGIPCALIEDSGHVLPPHFTGSPIITALGFGPAPRDQVRGVSRLFQLVT